MKMMPERRKKTWRHDEMFCYSITTDNDGNVIYINFAGRFGIKSYTGINYYFVCYVYKCNYIMVRTMKSRKDVEMVSTFKEVYEELKTKEHQPHTFSLSNPTTIV